MEMQGDFWWTFGGWGSGEIQKSKINGRNGEIQSNNFGYCRRNSKFITARGEYYFWLFRKQNDFENLKEIGELFHLGGDFKI